MIKVEDKKLLINDLCGRLHYGVICNIEGCGNKKLLKIEEDGPNTMFDFGDDDNGYPIQIYAPEVKPYLFPMSSMTEEQVNEYKRIVHNEFINYMPVDINVFYKWNDYLNEHHFDYRGLIEKGLAIDATNLKIY